MTEALKRDYRICEEIGRGRFGVVRRCEPLRPSAEPSSASSLAVKSIDKSAVSGDDLDSHCLLMEPKVLSLLSPHPNLLRIHSTYEDSSHLHLVLDLCDSPDLHLAVASAGPLPEPEAARILSQLMCAVAHCHRHGVVHRDIKPDNILFDSRGRLRLADFGSAEVIGGDPAARLKGVVGTPYYVAPEVVEGREYGEKVDLWSAGVVLYVMLAGFPPFNGESVAEIFGAVLRANLRFPPRAFRSASATAKDLLRKMLCRDVSRRFSADQVLRHPWLTSFGGGAEAADLQI
ncbi:phosphoenolpyruvate carboxylase kinase 2-like [Rhodamnia argentea]|uniref:Phosphoenolpyruvate carboxylase kinase 2-like n=1 Tax=Rhodamnia argentea TaxID=178133 RepID=A0A8B8N8Q5_9MYRT|nr:phosphoenolpyruvate carboxylase kinase 2-like [Rhodamnia argentea]XP_048128388.1 phosphoenolpyruvate carboxylase kinase 2-like [Rhodamnia argentea]XP_048128391.1 phosphoenolpyruvate carboxylase kinase 2-like [Rhodamnia argentea]XP_048128395.1 phosphoenolpyruvate carboxylase kinase 2-like [Rhodamnia argentea]